MKFSLCRGLLFSIWAFCSLGTTIGQSSSIPQVADSYALTNATVIASPGDTIFNATVLLKDGLIKSVGEDIDLPVYAQVIKCDSMYIYAGFIEGISNTGIPKKEESSQNGRNRNSNDARKPLTNAEKGIQPGRHASEMFVSTDKSIKGRRQLGFTTSHVVPDKGMIAGRGSLISLGSGNTDQLILKENTCMYARFDAAPRGYPRTKIGVIAKFREFYTQTEHYWDHMERYEGAENGVERPRAAREHVDMMPATKGKMPVVFMADDLLEMHQAYQLSDELGFNLVLADVKQGWDLADRIEERQTPVLVSLDLPKEPRKDEDSEDEEDVDAEREALLARQVESLKQYEANAAVLAQTGTPMAFSTLTVKDKEFKGNVSRMIEAGLSNEQVLAGLTTAPAEMFGMSSRLGTVERGKLANLVVATGPYFDEDSQVRFVFVEGEKFEYEVKEKKKRKKADSDLPDAKPEGKWTFAIDIPNDEQSGIIEITGEEGDYDGKIYPEGDDDHEDLEDILVDGPNVTFNLTIESDGGSLLVEFDLIFDGDSFEGEVDAGPMGSFPVEGERIPN